MSRVGIGLIGARGHVGAELLRLLHGHPHFELCLAVSRERAGQSVYADRDLCYVNADAKQVAQSGCDALILALPNGLAEEYVTSIERTAPDTCIIDLSADYRFDSSWHYGLPELTTQNQSSRRISNPGCYATAMQLLIAPMRDSLQGPVQCFGVSGYSGAGTTPSDKNNEALLEDNLMPYALTDHVHEREVSFRINHLVEFMPHVAAYFRGITLTANMHLSEPTDLPSAEQRYSDFYAHAPLIEVQTAAPWVTAVTNKPGALLGGFTLDSSGKRLVAVCCLDNLLKGAASQALQNLNRAFGFPELMGVVA
jgi:N-acetyl-gamma-glutamyl-phosphate reductase